MSGSYLYIPINSESKRPVAEFGGWPIDPEHEGVFERETVEESNHDWWAIVAHKTSSLLIIDVDLYKMSESQKAQVDVGWFGILDDTRIVKTPSGGIHVYLLTDCKFEDLPQTIEHVDLKGDVARGYALSHPKSEYVVKNDKRPVEVPPAIVRELPVFESSIAKGGRETAEPIVTEEDMRKKTAPPCLEKALDSDDEFADRLVNAVKYGTVDKLPVYRVLNRSQYPEGTNKSAPSWLHDTPSKTGTNFRVDEGGETFRCWRHDVTGNAYHLIGVEAGIIECGEWAYEQIDMSSIKEYARNNGYLTDDDVIKCETVKANDMCPFECGRRHPFDGVIQ